jgi:hypothetical protein
MPIGVTLLGADVSVVKYEQISDIEFEFFMASV